MFIQAVQGFFRKRVDRWLFQLGGAETGEVFLKQRRVFIIPTRAGMAFGVLLMILFIGSVNYSLSLGFALTFLIAACAIIDMHFTFRNLAHLSLAAGRTQAVYAGEEARFELQLINRTKRDRYAIWVGFIDRQSAELAQPVDIAAQSTQTVTLGLLAKRRGWLAAPRVRLQTRFPLGLLQAWSYWKPDMQALVYPQPEAVPAPLPTAALDEQDAQGQAGHDDFAGVRAYQSGDPLKHLAWRQIARLDTGEDAPLITKHFEGGAASELLFDFSALPPYLDTEEKLSRMTRWLLEAEARGLPYAFRLGDIAYDSALGPTHQAQCLQALALFEEPR
jgi:uncharacterized protein (DUF58 family)